MFTHVAHNSGIGWSAIFLENHDQSRCLNKFLERENISFYSASALASIYFFYMERLLYIRDRKLV